MELYVVTPQNGPKRRFINKEAALSYQDANGKGMFETWHLDELGAEKEKALIITAYSGIIQEGVKFEDYQRFVTEAFGMSFNWHELENKELNDKISEKAYNYAREICNSWTWDEAERKDKKTRRWLIALIISVVAAFIMFMIF